MSRRISLYLLLGILAYFLLTIWANRATLSIVDQEGKPIRTIIQKSKRDGQNIQL